MNILYMFYYPIVPSIGGVQRVTETLAIGLKKRGHDIYYLSIYKSQDCEYPFPVPQLTVDYSENAEKAKEAYLHILDNYNIDTVICQGIGIDLMDVLSATPENIARITCYHGRPFYDQSYTRQVLRYYNRFGIKEFFYKTFCRIFPKYHSNKLLQYSLDEWRKAFSSSDYICLLSELFFDRLCHFTPFANRNKLIAFNNPNSFPCPAEYNDFKKEKIILWVARHENGSKNFPLFIDFWGRFSKHHSDWKAIVLGDGDDLTYNKRYATEKKTKELTFLGNQTDVAYFYKRASFIMMTSFGEGWGMVLTEAMSFGCIPCAFDTFESLHDIIDDEENGIIIKPFCLKKAISRIEEIIDNPDFEESLRNNCMNKVKNFEAEKIVSKWEDFLLSHTMQNND